MSRLHAASISAMSAVPHTAAAAYTEAVGVRPSVGCRSRNVHPTVKGQTTLDRGCVLLSMTSTDSNL
jgi:hypothetical protein